MKRRGWWLIIFGSVWCACSLRAEVLHVPQDYPTIQTALNAVANNDSVLVSLDTYAEELSAPPLHFWLIGNVEIDTGNFPRPVIDPSTLDSARWRRCLNVPNGSEPVIEKMAFVNRAPMYPPYDSSQTGGVFVSSILPVTFRYCSFDSIHRAIAGPNFTGLPLHLVTEDCVFQHATFSQIRTDSPEGTVEVRRCTFQGGHYFAGFISGGDNSTIEDCIFSGESMSQWIYLYGNDPVVRRCAFGPADSLVDPVMRVNSFEGGIVENNVIVHSSVQNGLAAIGHRSGEPISFRHNALIDNRVWTSPGLVGIGFGELSGGLPGEWHGTVDSNVFQASSQTAAQSAKAIYLGTRTRLTGNRFFALSPPNAPVIDNWYGTSPLSEIRFSHFESGDYAIDAGPYPIDAIYNYWGDPSGPYNPIFNPNGLGARVDDSVLFNPWCPDTNCFESALEMPSVLTPSSFILSAYPNPFNSTLHLTLIPSEVGIVKLELYDVLGRRVEEIWSGPLAFRKDITFDASGLASGIYFARVTDVLRRSHLATAKLVLLK